MKRKALLAATLASSAVALGPAGALAADPTDAVRADLAQLSTDVTLVHDTLSADLGAIAVDARNGNRAAARADLAQARADRKPLFVALARDRKQVLTDLKAARAAGIDRAALKPLVEPVRTANRAALTDLRHARRDALAALRSLRAGASA